MRHLGVLAPLALLAAASLPAQQKQPPPPTPVPIPVRRPEIVRMSGSGVYFALNQFALTQLAKDTLSGAVKYLKEHPDAKVEVQGHTDNTGADAYNQLLSVRRADAVKVYFVSLGIAADRITAKGFGKTQPVADNKTVQGRSQNRRVVVLEVP